MPKRNALPVILCFLLAAVCLFLSAGVKQEPFQTLISLLEAKGYRCSPEPFAFPEERAVPIYDATVWYRLRLGSEELLAYFDSSNRANYLAEVFCSDPSFGRTVSVGLRYILCYAGEDAEILRLLDTLEKAYPT